MFDGQRRRSDLRIAERFAGVLLEVGLAEDPHIGAIVAIDLQQQVLSGPVQIFLAALGDTCDRGAGGAQLVGREDRQHVERPQLDLVARPALQDLDQDLPRETWPAGARQRLGERAADMVFRLGLQPALERARASCGSGAASTRPWTFQKRTIGLAWSRFATKRGMSPGSRAIARFVVSTRDWSG